MEIRVVAASNETQTMKNTKNFTDPAEAQAFGLALRDKGFLPLVKINAAKEAVYVDRPDSLAAEAEIASFAEKGEELGPRALAWAKESPWWGGEGSLSHAVSCLESDLEEDGRLNGAASYAQAGLFLKRLKAALSRAPKKSGLFTEAAPQSWDIVWETPDVQTRDTDSDDVWGASVGSDGWRCD